MLAHYSWHFLGKRIELTDIFRTREEQDKIYLNHKEVSVRVRYKKRPWRSVHMFGRGIDISTRYFDKPEIDKLLKLANLVPYDLNRPRKKTAIYHDVGAGAHIHVQTFYG